MFAAVKPMMIKPRLLLIEDDAALQTLLVELLELADYDVSVAMAYDYLFMVQETKPEILVLGCDGDYTFERGWQIARTVRAYDPTTALVLLSTTPSVVKEVGRTPRGKLFVAGLTKPFTLNEFLETLAVCCPSPTNTAVRRANA